MKSTLVVLLVCAAVAASAQNREGFMLQQTQQELHRVTGQMDVLQSNFDDLQRRVGRLEGGGDTKGLRAEIEALKAAVAELRHALQSQRGEIVRDLSGRLAKMQPQPEKKPAKPVATTTRQREYVVQSGDTLSFISQTFNVPVSRIRELNSLKGNNLRVGQKIMLPLEK